MMMKMQLFIVLGLVLIGTMVEVGKGAPGEQPEDPSHQTQPGTLNPFHAMAKQKTVYKVLIRMGLWRPRTHKCVCGWVIYKWLK